jgi:glycosyltransferase involved in cell wall biosynthesis
MLSVIIHTHESERAVLGTLSVLVAGAAAGVVREVIIADARSKDATAEVADVAGCQVLVSSAPLAVRLREAASAARAPWLLFLRPGAILDGPWIMDVKRFMDGAEESSGERSAVFRPAAGESPRSLLSEAWSLLRAAFGGRHPRQGLLIAKAHYERVGGHRDGVEDPEIDLLRRLGRSVVMLRNASVIGGG